MIIQKQNESYTLLISENTSDIETLQKIQDFLKAEKPDAKYNFKVQRGWESPYNYFTEVKKIKESNQSVMKIMNGHLSLLSSYGLDIEQEKSEFTEEEIDSVLDDIRGLCSIGGCTVCSLTAFIYCDAQAASIFPCLCTF